MPDGRPPEPYQPLALLAVILGALLLFALFFIGFLVAPLAILLLFYVGFAASDRAKRNGSTQRLADEAEARRQIIERSEQDQTAPPVGLSRLGA
jgi:hypothetical protein